MFKLNNPFTRHRLQQSMQAIDERYPGLTLGLAVFVTGFGYLLLALPPLLLLIGLFKLPTGIANATSFTAWLALLPWFVITAVSAVITYSMLRTNAALPSGLGLKEDKAPRLYELLTEMRETYKMPKIHRVTIHDHCELELVPVPRFGLPFISTNVLYIGLPVLQNLSPIQFRAALARRLGQYSARHNKLTHWIYRWRQYCRQCRKAHRKSGSFVSKPLQWFFNLYTPMMIACTAPAARRDELQADMYTLELMNDKEVAEFILRNEVCRTFLRKKYWPKIHAMLRKQPGNPEHLPHINMPRIVRKALTENEFAQILKELIDQEPAWNEAQPVLHSRLENIGQTKLKMPPPVMETAAQRYLGEAFAAVVKLLDKQWLARLHGKSSAQGTTQPPVPAPAANSEVMIAEPAQAPAAKPAPVNSQQPARHSAQPATTKQVKASTPKPVKSVSEADLYQKLSSISSEEVGTVTITERKRFADLKNRVQAGKLSDNEAWELANLTEKIEGKTQAIGRYQQVLRQNPNHAKTLFAVGRILLLKNDPSGVKALERAMALDKGCVAQGCWMLAKYFKACGDEARSLEYLKRAAA